MTDHRNTPRADRFADWRDSKGRFGKGNQEVVEAMVREAKAGNVQAQKLFIERCLGPAEALDLLARLSELEDAVSASVGHRS